MMINVEEFSFPIIKSNANVTNLSVLPPLWRISSVNQSHHDAELEENGRKRKIFRRSFSDIEAEINAKGKINNDTNDERAKLQIEEEADKMDMLWEDFNEELQSSSDSGGSDSDQNNNNNNILINNDINNVCREAIQVCSSRSVDDDMKHIPIPCGGLMISTKKRNLELVVNKLKKLFLIHNIARNKNRHLPS